MIPRAKQDPGEHPLAKAPNLSCPREALSWQRPLRETTEAAASIAGSKRWHHELRCRSEAVCDAFPDRPCIGID